MSLTRRGFLGRAAAALGALALGKSISARPAQEFLRVPYEYPSEFWLESSVLFEEIDLFEGVYQDSIEDIMK